MATSTLTSTCVNAKQQAEEEEEEDGEETRRLAVCRCDWDKVRAVDILVLLQSFVPATGAILSVTVYPSRLGQQRLEEEVYRSLPLEAAAFLCISHPGYEDVYVICNMFIYTRTCPCVLYL